jgi:hypothetical protein
MNTVADQFADTLAASGSKTPPALTAESPPRLHTTVHFRSMRW